MTWRIFSPQYFESWLSNYSEFCLKESLRISLFVQPHIPSLVHKSNFFFKPIIQLFSCFLTSPSILCFFYSLFLPHNHQASLQCSYICPCHLPMSFPVISWVSMSCLLTHLFQTQFLELLPFWSKHFMSKWNCTFIFSFTFRNVLSWSIKD